MADNNVAFLNMCSLQFRYHDRNVDMHFQLSTIISEKADRRTTQLACHIDCSDHISAVATCGNTDKDVPFACVGFDLPSKYVVITVIVGHRGENGRVGSQGKSRQASTLGHKTPNQFCSDVLRVRGAPAISAQKEFVATPQAGGDPFARILYGRLKLSKTANGSNMVV